jgi:cobalt-zinc-cadmium efflux system protein
VGGGRDPPEEHDGEDSPSRGERRTVTRSRRLVVALVLNVILVVAQVLAGVAAHSLGLLADAGHNLTDVAAIVISLVAVRLALRRPTAQRSFGYHRATILAALANAASILAITIFIAVEAVRRFDNPEPVRGGIVVAVALVAFAVNAGAAVVLRERNRDLNMRSALLHMLADAGASLGVTLAGLVILVTAGWYWLDPAMSLVIGVVISWEAWKLLRASIEVLLEATPQGLDVSQLVRTMDEVEGVESVHDLHAWSLSSDVRALSAHVVLEGHPSLEEAQVVGDRVKRVIGQPFGIAHATLELECEACAPAGDECGMDDLNASPEPAHGQRH